MKKVLVAFAVVSVFAASCNENNTSSTEVKKTDTPAVTPVKVDSPKIDSPATPIKVDSPKVDSPKVEVKK
jgi:PBP1b-binding outer membrane lipoprotein LpoB